jgi:hypothetical protein
MIYTYYPWVWLSKVLEDNNFIDMEEKALRGRELVEEPRRVSVVKALSDRPQRKDERVFHRDRSSGEAIP